MVERQGARADLIGCQVLCARHVALCVALGRVDVEEEHAGRTNFVRRLGDREFAALGAKEALHTQDQFAQHRFHAPFALDRIGLRRRLMEFRFAFSLSPFAGRVAVCSGGKLNQLLVRSAGFSFLRKREAHDGFAFQGFVGVEALAGGFDVAMAHQLLDGDDVAAAL